LKRADLERAPFAISNLGMFGVDVFQPSVFAGQSAVLGTGRAVDAAGGRKTAWFTLACDHRAVDGAEAARFFQTLQQEIDAQ
jgi:pyruvate dehydrogenase E2 component (dihydrolipoamide acetyltransferase)